MQSCFSLLETADAYDGLGMIVDDPYLKATLPQAAKHVRQAVAYQDNPAEHRLSLRLASLYLGQIGVHLSSRGCVLEGSTPPPISNVLAFCDREKSRLDRLIVNLEKEAEGTTATVHQPY